MTHLLSKFAEKLVLVIGTLSLLAISTGAIPGPSKLEPLTRKTKVFDLVPLRPLCSWQDRQTDFQRLTKPFQENDICIYGGKNGNH